MMFTGVVISRKFIVIFPNMPILLETLETPSFAVPLDTPIPTTMARAGQPAKTTFISLCFSPIQDIPKFISANLLPNFLWTWGLSYSELPCALSILDIIKQAVCQFENQLQ